MSRLNLFTKGKSYTFRSYFEMTYEPEDILSEFGVRLITRKLTLPKGEVALETVNALKLQLEKRLEVVSLSSELARRETLSGPILFEVALLTNSQLRIEYPLVVNEHLKGKLDYLVRGPQNVVVVEAKNDDLARGFTQLATELIAISKTEESKDFLYGAVTTGEVWLFGQFDVQAQEVTKDRSLYLVPDSLHDVMSILLGIITTPQLATA